MPRQYKVTLLTILLCLVAIEVPADSWDEEIPLAPTTATNYSEEIALMREWIKKQVAWIDGQLGFVPTSILSIHDAPADHDGWYDLQGRKFTNKPTDRGIYIHQGNKEVIK